MKTTNKLCFSNGTEMMYWQEKNCCQCAKATWYNEKLKKFPNYRCAVQRDIEAQAAGVPDINIRSYDAANKSACPFFVSKNERKKKQDESDIIFDAHDFAKGESLAGKLPFKEEEPPKPIERQAEQPKQQKYDEIWDEKIKPAIGGVPIKEDIFKQRIKKDVENMLKTFSWDENMMIAFVPLIISHIAWIYSKKAMTFCTVNKLSDFKKIGREIKALRQEYIYDLERYLDAKHIRKIEFQTEEFLEKCNYDFTVLWYQINGIIKRDAPDLTFDTMRTDAAIAVLMIHLLERHNRKMDVVVAEKMNNKAVTTMNPIMVKLEKVLTSYIPKSFNIETDSQIDLCKKIFEKNLRKIEFVVEG